VEYTLHSGRVLCTQNAHTFTHTHTYSHTHTHIHTHIYTHSTMHMVFYITTPVSCPSRSILLSRQSESQVVCGHVSRILEKKFAFFAFLVYFNGLLDYFCTFCAFQRTVAVHCVHFRVSDSRRSSTTVLLDCPLHYTVGKLTFCKLFRASRSSTPYLLLRSRVELLYRVTTFSHRFSVNYLNFPVIFCGFALDFFL